MVRFQCQQCRREIEVPEAQAEQGMACPLCGAAVVAPAATFTPVAPPAVPETAKTSGRAIASFFCGLAECIGGFTSILAVIFGIMAIREINRSEGRLKGMWMAVTGLVLGGLFLLLLPTVLLPALMGAIDAFNHKADENKLYCIGLAFSTYATKYNGHYPTVYSKLPTAGEEWGPGFDPKTGAIADAAAPTGPNTVHGPYTCNLSCLYRLVRTGDAASPNIFLCPTAPNTNEMKAPNAAELWSWSFQNINQCNFSYQNQLGRNTTQMTGDPRMVLVADASPLRPGTVLPSDGKPAWEHNSPIFKFKGQNCLYADGHVAWTDTPNCGYGGNNIWLRSEMNENSAGSEKWIDDPDSTKNPTATIGDKYDTFLVP